MRQVQVIDLAAHRNRVSDEAYEQGRTAGIRHAEFEHSVRKDRYHEARLKIHGRWVLRGFAATFVLVALLMSKALWPLHDMLLCLTGCTATFTVFHLYYWDRHFSAD